MRAVVLCLLCATAGCGPAPLSLGFGVAVTASFDSTVTDGELARVTQLIISATGDETYETDQQLNRGADRVESFVYRPLDSTRRLALSVAAEDGNGLAVAAGSSAQIQLTAGQTAQLQITLFPKELPDAGPPDGTVVDAGAHDSGEDASPPDLSGVPFPLCSAVTSGQLCLDFEQAIPSTWTTVQNNSAVVVDTTYAHSGTHSLHVHLESVASAMSAGGYLTEMQTFTTSPSAIHVRAFIFFRPEDPPPLQSALPIFVAAQNAMPYGTMDFELNEAHYAMYDYFASTTDYTETSSSFPTAAWQCIEWVVQVGSPGTMALSSNGAVFSANEIHDTTASTPPLGILQVGGQLNNSSTQASPVVDLWLDDIVVSSTLIGCAHD
jgi:hypothetical protein